MTIKSQTMKHITSPKHKHDNFVMKYNYHNMIESGSKPRNDNFVINHDHHHMIKSPLKLQNDHFVTKRDHHDVTKSPVKIRNDHCVMNRDHDRSHFWRPSVILPLCHKNFLLSLFMFYINKSLSQIVTESPFEKSRSSPFMTKWSSYMTRQIQKVTELSSPMTSHVPFTIIS